MFSSIWTVAIASMFSFVSTINGSCFSPAATDVCIVDVDFEKKGLATTSVSSSDVRYFLALLTAILSEPASAVKGLFDVFRGVRFGGGVFAFCSSAFVMVGVISRNEFERFGLKNDLIDFDGVGSLGGKNVLAFSLSSVMPVIGAFVMGCRSPFATPLAISTSRSLRSEMERGNVHSNVYQ